ncbi:hypothetical protein LCGC14_0193100 [marine sediment metagenome]|uniref:Uncharacterized protein n=1 Tax=marine sediment metagenome TaxID=412755 RepID=A0A0F9XNM6_9ZZZZ
MTLGNLKDARQDGVNKTRTKSVVHQLNGRVPLLISLDDSSVTPAQVQSPTSGMAIRRNARVPYVETKGEKIRVRNPLGSCRGNPPIFRGFQK